MKTIYRIELVKPDLEIGMGPYRISEDYINLLDLEYGPFYDLSRIMASKHNGVDHPGMWRDFEDELFVNSNPGEYHCGFSTIEDLKAWFSGFSQELHKLGYKVVEYTVKNYCVIEGISGKQTIFTKPKQKNVTNILEEWTQQS